VCKGKKARRLASHTGFETADYYTTGLNYLCEGYKAFFGHITPHMKLMAAELLAGRSPANIMLAMAKQDTELK